MLLVSQGLHAWRTPGVDNEIWYPDADELDGIAAPLSRIAARRVPAGLIGGDVGDGVELATATTAYATRNIVAEANWKRAQKAASVTVVDLGDGAVVEQPPAGPWPPATGDPLDLMRRQAQPRR